MRRMNRRVPLMPPLLCVQELRLIRRADRRGCTMVVRRIKHRCGHWQEWVLPTVPRTAGYYVDLLIDTACPWCVVRTQRVETARKIVNETRGMPPAA